MTNGTEAWPIPEVAPPPFLDPEIEDTDDIDLTADIEDEHEYESAPSGLKLPDLFKSLVGLVLYPTTLVDDNGVPTGILYPDGTVVDAIQSRVGQQETLVDTYGIAYATEVVWDGAKPDPNGHSKGLLIEEYETTGELWRRIALGGHGYFRKFARRHQGHLKDDSENMPGDNHV